MDLVGKTLGQYHIVEPIGHGGMAAVYKAQQPALNRFVAVKVLLPQQADRAEFRLRFDREAHTVAQLNHPNILPIIDYGQTDELSYIVTKYVSGGTLADRLKHPIDLATSARLIAQIAAALDHAHQRGVIHRDVKPSNVLLDEGEWVQLADFGLVKLLYGDQSITNSGLGMGTPAYLSPEQGQGVPLDHHSDIYSLGVVLYEMVTGRLPFTAETAMGVIIKHIYDQPALPRALNPSLPEAVEAIVLKALAKPVSERFDTAGELAQALQAAISAAPAPLFAPVQGIDSNATPRFSLQTGPPTPAVISNKILFEETVPAVPSFVGRGRELAAYRARLDRDQLVVITGMAGIGKTTLGARLARDMALSADHIFWFTFDRVEKSTVDALYWALASFLDNRGEPSLSKYLHGEIGAQKPLEQMAKLNLLMAALATGHYVLCFDDFQIVKDVPEIAYVFKVIRQRFVELKQSLPARLILIGREVPTDMEYLAAQSLAGLAEADLPDFLSARGVVLSPWLTHQLWQHTEGNPKLLELAAGSLIGVPESAAENFITSLVRRGDIRDYLMTNIYAALTAEEQLVMSALAVFPGPVERAGVEEILAEEGVTRIVPHLDALANKHMLTVDEDDQIDCHDLVREYCYHVLNRRDRDRFHQHAADYFEQEKNWLAAAYHHFERRDAARSLNLLIAHADEIINAGKVSALTEQLARFNVTTLKPEQRMRLYQTQGNCYRIRGEYQQAIRMLEAARGETASDAAQAEFLQQIGLVQITAGAYDQALEQLQNSLKRYEALGQATGIANAHRYLGWAHFRQGKFDQAHNHFSISEQIAKQLDDRHLLADVGVGLGSVLWKEGRLTEAQAYLEESARIFREVRDRFGEANALDNLGLAYGWLGNLSRRITQHLEASHAYEEIGYLRGLSISINNLAHAYFLNRQYTESIQCYSRLAQLSQASGNVTLLSLACAGLADAYLGQGLAQLALEQAEAAQRSAEQVAGALECGVAYRVLGDAWLALSDPRRAQQFYEQSMPLLAETGEPEELARAQAGHAQALALLKDLKS